MLTEAFVFLSRRFRRRVVSPLATVGTFLYANTDRPVGLLAGNLYDQRTLIIHLMLDQKVNRYPANLHYL